MDSRNRFAFEKPRFVFSQNDDKFESSSSQLSDSNFPGRKGIPLGRENSSQRPDSSMKPVAVPFPDIKIPVAYGDKEALFASLSKKNRWAIIVVKGYDNPFPETEETKKALLDHLSSCGKIRRFDYADDPFNRLTERCALIEVWGKKGVAKAVELHGSVMEGGQKIAVRPALTLKEMAANMPFRSQSFGSAVPST